MGDDALQLTSVRFSDLPDWDRDQHGEALPAFLASCAVLATMPDDKPIDASPFGGTAKEWRRVCRKAKSVVASDHAAAKRFFETEFSAYATRGQAGSEAKFTGYYVQPLRGSRKRGGVYQTPIHSRPNDLVAVKLDDFVADGRGRRIWGRVKDGRLVPYSPRAQWRKGKRDVLLWVDDPIDAIFAEIQGSGRVQMDDGSEVWLHFAGKNGLKFRGVGGILRGMGELEKGEGTMQGIRAWLEKNPHRFHEISDQNPAKVFFTTQGKPGAQGTQGVILTPRRSMAVDRAAIPLSAPVWIDTVAPVAAKNAIAPWRRLVVAQDTGGAIMGAIRGDLYWGDDKAAGDIAGRMSGGGRMWVLLPKSIKLP